MARILILSKDEKTGKYTRWAECTNDAELIELVQYFASSAYCEDFIVYFENYGGCVKPFAVKLPEICKAKDIKMKYPGKSPYITGGD